MDMYNPQDLQGLLQTQGQVGGNAANAGIGFGANSRSAGRGKQDAFQKLAMLRIMQGGARGKMMQDLQSQMQQQGIQDQQATPFDYLGAVTGGIGAASGIAGRDDAYNSMGLKRKNAFQQIFG